MESARYRVVACNTAPRSENAIHRDDVAQGLGFRGGLVPGVDVWAYLAHLPAERWGRPWLELGEMRGEFRRPVYDGDTVEVTGRFSPDDTVTLELRDGDGQVCANAAARVVDTRHDVHVDVVPPAPLPEARPAAAPETLAPGTLLGTFEIGFRAEKARSYLDDVRETLPLFRGTGFVHPAWLLRLANWSLAANVTLGPWIHVGSDVRHLGLGTDGDRLALRSRVLAEYERKGHRFVVLDVLVVANGVRPLLRGTHTAIYRPRGL